MALPTYHETPNGRAVLRRTVMATDKQIQNYAYQLWQQAGCPEGKDDEFWHKAKAELEANPDAAKPPLPNDDPS
jgi:hypothetical protein